jgi:hypothetical protein
MQVVPRPEDIERTFEELLSGSRSREDADRWAGQWVYVGDPPRMPEAHWQALKRLAGCDLRHGPNLPYLHSDDQVRSWLEEFRTQKEAR